MGRGITVLDITVVIPLYLRNYGHIIKHSKFLQNINFSPFSLPRALCLEYNINSWKWLHGTKRNCLHNYQGFVIVWHWLDLMVTCAACFRV